MKKVQIISKGSCQLLFQAGHFWPPDVKKPCMFYSSGIPRFIGWGSRNPNNSYCDRTQRQSKEQCTRSRDGSSDQKVKRIKHLHFGQDDSKGDPSNTKSSFPKTPRLREDFHVISPTPPQNTDKFSLDSSPSGRVQIALPTGIHGDEGNKRVYGKTLPIVGRLEASGESGSHQQLSRSPLVHTWYDV